MSLNGRRFLKQPGVSLGILAGAGLVSKSMANGRADANSQINIAAIGTGGRGSFLMNQIGGHKDAVITTVCDVNKNYDAILP